jgi:hypothetical protein
MKHVVVAGAVTGAVTVGQSQGANCISPLSIWLEIFLTMQVAKISTVPQLMLSILAVQFGPVICKLLTGTGIPLTKASICKSPPSQRALVPVKLITGGGPGTNVQFIIFR